MKNNTNGFEFIKNSGISFYKTLPSIRCSYLQDTISFTADGLEHLQFKSRGRSRSKEDQYMRFKLIPLVPEILKRSHTLQGVLETRGFEKVRIHSRTEHVLKHVTYYEFIAVIKRERVKIIIKKIENGNKFFWSIIPFWRMNKKIKSRILHEGVPEED